MITYVPHASYAGADSFSFVANDGQANSTPALVVLAIAPVNDAPAPLNDISVTFEATAVQVAVLGNDHDPDGDLLAVTAVGAAAHGTTGHDGTRVTYTPEPGFTGSDSFTYSVGDPAGAEAIATVTVTVTASGNPIEMGWFDTPGNANDLAMAEGLAYIADQWVACRSSTSRIRRCRSGEVPLPPEAAPAAWLCRATTRSWPTAPTACA